MTLVAYRGQKSDLNDILFSMWGYKKGKKYNCLNIYLVGGGAIRFSYREKEIKEAEKKLKKIVSKNKKQEKLINKLNNEITKQKEKLETDPSLKIYISLNCAESITTKESDDKLSDKTKEFLSSKENNLLILGDSGAYSGDFEHLFRKMLNSDSGFH